MMTCYCHLCGKMKPGNQLKLHYEKVNFTISRIRRASGVAAQRLIPKTAVSGVAAGMTGSLRPS
jgi:hypothetical protein